MIDFESLQNIYPSFEKVIETESITLALRYLLTRAKTIREMRVIEMLQKKWREGEVTEND